MNRLTIKDFIQTLVLFILIALSLFLTWTIITYQERITVSNEVALKPNALGDRSSINERVRPKLIVAKDSGQYYGGQDWDYVELLWSAFQDAKIQMNTQSTHASSLFPKRSAHMILKFEKLAIGDFAALFERSTDVPEGATFEYVALQFSNLSENELSVYFTDETNGVQYRGKIKDVNPTFLKQLFAKMTETAARYTPVKLPSGYTTFLRQDASEYEHIAFLAEELNTTLLRNVFFAEDQRTSRTERNGQTVYTDGKHMLTIDANRNVVRYRIGEEKETTVHFATSLANQINFINNSLGGWRDDFYFDGYAALGNGATYRLYMNDLPAYSTEDSSELTIGWSTNQFNAYSRPRFTYKGQIASETFKVDLMRGSEVMKKLKDTPSIDMTNVEDVFIGYSQYVYNQPQGLKVVRFDPSWLVQYNGEIYRLDDIIRMSTLRQDYERGGE
ncbi:MAG: YycH family regulatory protein [Bacilli bacterium]